MGRLKRCLLVAAILPPWFAATAFGAAENAPVKTYDVVIVGGTPGGLRCLPLGRRFSYLIKTILSVSASSFQVIR